MFKSTAPFDLILSNPPYVSKKDEISEEVLTHEPGSALFPSPLGSIEEPDYFYDNFLTQVASILRPGGASFFEVPHERADEILIKFKAGGAKQAELISDLTGRPRVLRASF